MKKDMTQGKILPMLIMFILPLVAGNILQNMYSMVDSLLVGRFVSLNALAAIGSTTSITVMILGLAGGLTSGFGVIISQAFGAKDYAKMRRAIGLSYVLSALIGFILMIISLSGLDLLLRLVKSPEEIVHDSKIYLTMTFIGIIPTIGYNILSTILRAVGDSRTPLLKLVLSSVLNIIGDLIFIIVIPWGVFGVALATFIAHIISGLSCWFYIQKKYPELRISREDIKWDRDIIRQLLTIGVPAALQFSVMSIGNIIVQTKVNEFGAKVVASYAVAMKIDSLMYCMIPAIGGALLTFCGQNLGARDFRRIRQGTAIAYGIEVCLSAVLFTIAYFLSGYIALLFVDASETAVIADIKLYLRMSTMFYPMLGAIFLFRSASQGLGSGIIPLISGTLELSARLFVAFMLVGPLGFFGICLSNPCSWTIAGTFGILAFIYRLRKLERQNKSDKAIQFAQ